MEPVRDEPSVRATAATSDAGTRCGGLAGVNVGGYLRTEGGMGAAVRGYLRALRSLAIPVALKDVSAVSGNRAEDRTAR